MQRGPGTLFLNATLIFKDRLSLMGPRLALNSPSHCLYGQGWSSCLHQDCKVLGVQVGPSTPGSQG